MSIMDTHSVDFSVEELWCLFTKIPRESQADYSYPPHNEDLEESVVEGLNYCIQNELEYFSIELTKAMCIAICYNINRDDKDAFGKTVGKDILIKTFNARAVLRDEPVAIETEDDFTFTDEMKKSIDKIINTKESTPKKRRKAPTSKKEE